MAQKKRTRPPRRRPTPKPRADTRRISRPAVEANQVVLVPGKGTAGHGGDPGGFYWHIEAEGKRAGNVFINMFDHAYYGNHPSIQIHINQAQRGRKIGRIAYRLACEQSGYDTVYAHMRKSNIASRRAAEEAGFVAFDDETLRRAAAITNSPVQMSMSWKRSRK